MAKLLHDIFKRSMFEDLYLAAARGIVPDAFVFHGFGLNEALGPALETISDFGGLYPWQVSASPVSLTSTSASDTFGGIGARTVEIEGLDANYDRINEIVELSGLAAAVSTKSFLRIFQINVPPLYDIGGNSIPGQNNSVGTITATQGGITVGRITIGSNSTQAAIYTIPRGYTGYIVHGDGSSGKGKDVTIRYTTRPFNGVFNLNVVVRIFEGTAQRPFSIPQAISEKTDIEARGFSDIESAVSASFDIICIKES